MAFDLPCFSYEESLSNAVRVHYTPRVFSAHEAPPEVQDCMSRHTDLAPPFPRHEWVAPGLPDPEPLVHDVEIRGITIRNFRNNTVGIANLLLPDLFDDRPGSRRI